TEANPAYETGVAGETGGGIYYIKDDGNLYYQHFKSWDFTKPDGEEILAEVDVRSVYGCEINSYAQFYIKSDDSLWGFGDNSDGRFGGSELGAINTEAGYITRENAVKLMDDVAEIYEFSDEVYIIKTDKTLWRFNNLHTDGVTDYTTSIEIAKNVIKVYADGQYLTEFDTVPTDDDPWQNDGFETTFAYIIPEKSGQNEGKPKYGITSDGTVAFVDSGIIVVTGVKLP
ncbi:MAG: hypothetical protein LBM41_02725, partial [Ruminococcus sp.]|nr:hypothetical protein [Ruminococcus sp.]